MTARVWKGAIGCAFHSESHPKIIKRRGLYDRRRITGECPWESGPNRAEPFFWPTGTVIMLFSRVSGQRIAGNGLPRTSSRHAQNAVFRNACLIRRRYEKARHPGGLSEAMVGVGRVELPTPAMSIQCSTTELYARTIVCRLPAHGRYAEGASSDVAHSAQGLKLTKASLPADRRKPALLPSPDRAGETASTAPWHAAGRRWL